MSNSHTVRAVFTFKDDESKNAFITFCNGERGLGITRVEKLQFGKNGTIKKVMKVTLR